MSKDLLSEATRALRDAPEVSQLEARATRARIMSGLHQTRVRRRTRYAYLLPLAATFVAASAWGAASGKAQLVWASIERVVTRSAPVPAAPSVHQSNRVLARRVEPSPEPAAANTGSNPSQPTETPPPVAAAPVANSALTPARAFSLANAATSSNAAAQKPDLHSSAPITPEEVADPTLALYRVAHTAHFVDHDPARALAAWDAYLAAAPNGTFAPEARYNRALSLVRLGRTSEAELALQPFASGVYGDYRQTEASALLERLGAPH